MMKQGRLQTVNRLTWLTFMVAVGVMGSVGVAGVSASEPAWNKHRGYVDGSALAELAEDDDTLVEVNIRGALLKIVSKAISSEDARLGEFLNQIVSINAVVVEGKKDTDRASGVISEMSERLEDRDWERLARIREDDADVVVYVLYSDEVIDGITVFVSEGSDVVFANIAGRIDLSLIGDLGAKLHIPGLGALSGDDWQPGSKKKKSRDKE